MHTGSLVLNQRGLDRGPQFERVHMPKVIDADTQVFNGRTYTRFGRYFRKRLTFLHREVWEHYRGPIPPGHHIHHRDGNGANNQIENLEPIEALKHLSDHKRGHGRRPVAAFAALAEWNK